MRTIKLKSLSLVNFKGIRSLNIGFSDAETLVAGENGTGKTTVFDSFLWLLFGKDSTGRSDSNFNIKTLDSDGKPILHLEHSVTGVLSVDGKTVTLQRCYVENWVKPRGTTEESLKNHATEFYLNGVKLATKKEYDSEVAAIIPEDVFRMITNPFYFTSMKPEAQKEILLDMVGTLTDQDVAQTKPEYLELLAQLSGRSIAQYAKEVAAKKKACKDELSVIPSQIETARKLMPEEEDWVAIDSEIEDKNARIQQIEEQIADKSKLNEQEYQRKAFIQKQIGEKRLQLNSRMNEIATEANKGRNEASEGANIGDWFIKGGKIVSTMGNGNRVELDASMARIYIESSSGGGDYALVDFGAKMTIDANRGIFETRAKNAPNYSNAVSYMSPTGIFSNMAGTDGMPASSGYTHRGAIVGLGFANVPARTWAINAVDTIVAGVYGRASNSGTAPAFGGFFYDLFAGGLIFGRKCITGTSNNTWYLNREDTVVIGYTSAASVVYLPASPKEGQVIFVKQWWRGYMRFRPRSGYLIYDDTSVNDYYDFGEGQGGMFVYTVGYVDGVKKQAWLVSRWKY